MPSTSPRMGELPKYVPNSIGLSCTPCPCQRAYNEWRVEMTHQVKTDTLEVHALEGAICPGAKASSKCRARYAAYHPQLSLQWPPVCLPVTRPVSLSICTIGFELLDWPSFVTSTTIRGIAVPGGKVYLMVTSSSAYVAEKNGK